RRPGAGPPVGRVSARAAPARMTEPFEFPLNGKPPAEVLRLLAEAGTYDVRHAEGRLFSLVYGVSDEHAHLLADAYAMYLATNGLGKGFLFQSLGRFEDEVIGRT